jgi:steroid 5-alpha reductase family enzyme
MDPVIFFYTLAAVTAMMVLGWMVSLLRSNVTLADSLWGLGFILIAVMCYRLGDGYMGRKLLLLLLVTAWGLRLSIYLTLRNWGREEDPRYRQWRLRSGSRFWIVSLTKVFLLQAAVMWVCSLALQYGILAPQPAHFIAFDLYGAVIWAVGFTFESVADWQMARFKADPGNAGRVLDKGLWAYSRHPNYFGEMLMWWGVFVVTLSTPVSFWTIISPLLISAVLLKMSGVPLTEEILLKKRPAYRDYIRTTSAFFPRRPRGGSR